MTTKGADYRQPTLADPGGKAAAITASDNPPAPVDVELRERVVASDDPPAPVDVELREHIVAPGEHGQRLDRVVVAAAPEFSRRHLQGLIERGHVRVDGAPQTTPSRRVRVAQTLAIALVPTDETLAFRPQPIALAVVYEDDDVLVVDKPAGLVVHPAAGNWQGTLLNGLLARDPRAAALPRAGIVHRLDKDTSGLIVVGRTPPAVTTLTRAIAARDVHRRYVALVHGVPAERAFDVDAPIGRDPRSRVRMAVTGGGKPARTSVERIGTNGAIAALSCTLHSGRTHQIRVHLAHVGHPIVGDTVYGGRPALGMQRQALHAVELRLAHPVTGRPLAFTSALPSDLAAACAAIGAAPVSPDRPV